MNLEVLLRHHHRTGDRAALDGVELSLRGMANGGIYDQLGGGFARYSVDEYWLVPHFEKMLYDNALLSRLYLEAHQATGDPFYRRIAEETLDYVLRDMTSPEGGFYSAEDADSEGEEGKFYVWTPKEMEGVLDPDDARLALRFWDVTEGGNFEGKNILNVPRPPEVVADEFGLSPRGCGTASWGSGRSSSPSGGSGSGPGGTRRCWRRGTGSCSAPSRSPPASRDARTTARPP
jgi:uncharacterized protein YyaL (SSP411 family)